MEHIQRFEPRPYRRAWWLPGAHLQTVGAWLLRPRRGLQLERERIETPDGDFLDLDFTVAPAEDAPVVLVLHGLEGGSRALPAMQALRSLVGLGMRGVALNFRSCSGEPNRAARSYHAGETGDLGLVLDLLRERFSDRPLGAIGYSLGGNVLLKYLGERGPAAAGDLTAAVAVSVPFDLAAGARRLERGFGRIYAAHFLRSLRRKARQKGALIGDRCDARRVARSRTLRDFDDAATAPLHGFRDVDHYYADSSSAQYLQRIRVPTLLLHATDDPFLPAEAVPHRAAAENPALLPVFTEHGGHMGFVAGGTPWRAQYWAEAEAARFLAHHLQR